MIVVLWAYTIAMSLAIPCALKPHDGRNAERASLANLNTIGILSSMPSYQKNESYNLKTDEALIEPPLTLLVNHRKWDEFPLGYHLVEGSAMWLALPGKGRYVLSLERRPGYQFRGSGTVQNQTIVFSAGTDKCEIRASKSIIARSPKKARHLYVLHQPTWEPKGPLFGTGKLEDLLALRT